MLHGVPQNEPRRAQDGPKRGRRPPKTSPRGTQEAKKSDPESQDEKRTESRRSQDRLGLNSGGVPPVYPHPRGAIWDPKMAPKPIPKRSKIDAKIEDEKKATQDDLGAVLERSWFDLGPTLGSILAKKYWKTYYFVKNTFLR